MKKGIIPTLALVLLIAAIIVTIYYMIAPIVGPSMVTAALQKGAERGDAKAQCGLGLMYANGRGVAKDLDQARKWFEKAAAQDHKQAKEYLKKLEELKARLENRRGGE